MSQQRMMAPAGKTFVVTGAGNGMGRCVALELVRRGAVVIGADLDAAALATTGQAVVDPPRFISRTLDVSTLEAIRAFVADTVESHHVDGLFNVAGIAQGPVPAVAVSDERVDALLDVNFLGAVRLVRELLPHLLTRPWAVIMNTASLSAVVPVPGTAMYGASKAALEMFGYGLRQDLRGSDVTVTTAIPGSIWTDLVRRTAEEMGVSAAMAKRFATPADVAARRMVDATLRRRRRALIGPDARAYDVVNRVSPALADRMSFLQTGRFVYR